jgi:DNA (cytosine-5)-methyltransferase 1
MAAEFTPEAIAKAPERFPNLETVVQQRMWPTPHGFSPDGKSNGPSGNELGWAVNRHWPTPTSRDWKDGTAQACRNVPPNGLLGRVVHILPTPTANRWDGLQSHGVNVVSGSLNPTWVEWLMGFPTGFTDLEP